MITIFNKGKNQIADESKKSKGCWKPKRKKVILGLGNGYTAKHSMAFWANHRPKSK